MEQIMEMLKAMQEKADANRKTDRENLKEMTNANQEEMLSRMQKGTDADRRNDRDELKQEMRCCQEHMDVS
jgi:hypothetical protein